MKVCLISDGKGKLDFCQQLESFRSALELSSKRISYIQMREFWLSEASQSDVLKYIKEFYKLAQAYEVKLIANAKIPEQFYDSFNGVHLNKESIGQFQNYRRRFGDSFAIGYSAHSLAEAVLVKQKYPTLDYLFLSPIFKPLSKTSSRKALGLESLERLSAEVSCPVYALGGVSNDNISDCISRDVCGVAGISLVNDIEALSCIAQAVDEK